MERYCRFLETMKDGEEVIWEKDKDYLVTFENDDVYYFGEPIDSGIEKKLKDKKFKIVIVE